MQVSDLIAFEQMMREERQLKRGAMCAQLGISQAKWRRHVEGRLDEDPVDDRTLGLAMAALEKGLVPYAA